MSVPTGRAVLSLYKQLLRTAVTHPTKKRASIIREIQNGFRESRNETDPKKLEALFAESFAALKEMRRYEVLTKSTSTDLKFNLHF
jgi:hypothetical protein